MRACLCARPKRGGGGGDNLGPNNIVAVLKSEGLEMREAADVAEAGHTGSVAQAYIQVAERCHACQVLQKLQARSTDHKPVGHRLQTWPWSEPD